MYARSSSFTATPDSIDEAIAYCRDEVLPAIERIDGCIGMSMMVDRRSGRTIATTAWNDLDTMRRSEQVMSRMRERGATIMSAMPKVEEWEISLLHRDHRTGQGACTRSSWMQVDPGRITRLEEAMRDALPQLEAANGFCSASLLLNYDSGMCVATTTWDNHTSMERSRPSADQLRAGIADEAGGRVAEVVEFELALAHLRVPELA